MADILIFVKGITATDNGDELEIDCSARCSTMDVQDPTIEFYALVSPGSLASTINTAIKNAGVTAAGTAGFTVGMLDKKNVIGGVVGL